MKFVASSVEQQAPVGAHQRILDVAYELFARRGVRDVGVDEVIARSGVAKATLYRHFKSKDDLVLAFLEQREQVWTQGIIDGALGRGKTPEQQLLATFDMFHEWFQGDTGAFESCSFIKVLLEMGADHPLGQASIGYLDNIRAFVKGLARDAGLREAEAFSRNWLILIAGATVAATAGDRRAARRSQAMGRVLINAHRGSSSPDTGPRRAGTASGAVEVAAAPTRFHQPAGRRRRTATRETP